MTDHNISCVVTSCFMGTLELRKKTCCEEVRNIRKRDLLIKDINILVPCKFGMLSFNRALVIKDYVWFAFLIVQTV